MTGAAAVVPGVVLALGALLVLTAFRRPQPRLPDALAVLGDHSRPAASEDPLDRGVDRLGALLLRRVPGALPGALDRNLRLLGRTRTRHAGLKVAWAGVGLLAPPLWGLAMWLAIGLPPAVPALAGPVLAVIGFVLPDLLLRGSGTEVTQDATEALLTFFDLVTLERLANQSATQSLHAAASLSDAAVFATIRSALERARLQQRMPYGELKQTGRELGLPALVDLADVLRLDETGASLSGTLRARVRELRDAHLTAAKVAAAGVSERMTLFMVVPSLVFGLFFLVPPLLTLLSNG